MHIYDWNVEEAVTCYDCEVVEAHHECEDWVLIGPEEPYLAWEARMLATGPFCEVCGESMADDHLVNHDACDDVLFA